MLERARVVVALVGVGACAPEGAPWVDRAAPLDDTGAAEPEGADPEPDGGDTAGDTGGLDTAAQAEDPAEPCATADGALPLAAEGAFLARDAAVAGDRAACTAAWHAAAGAAGSTLSLRLDASDDGGLWASATDLRGETVVPATFLAPGDAVELPLTQTGEVFVTLRPDDPGLRDDPAAAYAVTTTCVSGCESAYTRYPVVFLHGMGGTDTYLGVLDYWFGVQSTLDEAGFVAVTPAVDALASIDARAQQWQDILDGLAADGVGRRFNLIAHSQGGLDARLLAHAYDPERRVASVTTISAPHRGTPLADLSDGLLDLTPFDAWLVDGVVAFLAGWVGLSGPDLSAQLHDMTRASMATFNAEVPDRGGVAYWSWAGASCRGWDWGCQSDRGGEIIDPIFSASFRLLLALEGDNDGVVSVESARWGTFLGELPADHMDEVGQIADLLHPAFDAQAFYRDELERLAAEGL